MPRMRWLTQNRFYCLFRPMDMSYQSYANAMSYCVVYSWTAACSMEEQKKIDKILVTSDSRRLFIATNLDKLRSRGDFGDSPTKSSSSATPSSAMSPWCSASFFAGYTWPNLCGGGCGKKTTQTATQSKGTLIYRTVESMNNFKWFVEMKWDSAENGKL